MFAVLARKANTLARKVGPSMITRGYEGGVPGSNLPFDINNRYKLTAFFCVFIGSGLGAPFLIVRHQLLKQ